MDETDTDVIQPNAAFVDFNDNSDDGRVLDDHFYI